MNLKSVKIKNYRSIEDLSINFDHVTDDSFTYGLIGVNEAGKSSILKALALKENIINATVKDFRDKTKPIEIIFDYEIDSKSLQVFNEFLLKQPTPIEYKLTKLNTIQINYAFTLTSPAVTQISINLDNCKYEDCIKLQELLTPEVNKRVHQTIFWTAEDRFLISQPINLATFAASPEQTSIPLKNCFYLAGINDIQSRITLIGDDSTEIEQLQNELGEKVTEHIKTVWPNHPIQITFLISNGLINFHVKDIGSKGRSKTADQRSDGFKQFISFLLTVSAQDRNQELTESLLLLDEPETHLHPQAQQFLLQELIKITANKRNNKAFFATHSNYMIDKKDLSRNLRVIKKNDQTKTEKFDKKTSSYASISFEVFDIPSTDYHNELYSLLHEKFIDDDLSDNQRSYIKYFDEKYFHGEKKLKLDKPWKTHANSSTLPTYIRNCIHHPEGTNTYNDDELKRSINILRSYLV